MKSILLTALLLCVAGNARALTTTQSPYSAGRIYVGRLVAAGQPNDGRPYVCYQANLYGSGSCSCQAMGTATGLADDYLIKGSDAGDEVWVIAYSPPTGTICGQTMARIEELGGHTITIQTLGGFDVVDSGNDSAIFVQLGDGDDVLMCDNNATVEGNNGNDVLIGFAATTTTMLGKDGTDIFCSYNVTTKKADGGEGSDGHYGAFTTLISATSTIPLSVCNSWIDVIFDRMDDNGTE